MGNLTSRDKGNSAEERVGRDWSSAPSGSWIIRFLSKAHIKHLSQMKNKDKEVKSLPLFHWSCPEWVTADLFNSLLFVVVQIFLEGDYNKLTRLMFEPLEAVELINNFNVFVESTNEDVMELQNQLIEAAHQSIYIQVENNQLKYLDLLVTNDFDPKYELRSVLSRGQKNSNTSLLGPASSTGTSELTPKIDQAYQVHFPITSCEVPEFGTPLIPSAPWPTDCNEETTNEKKSVDLTDEICIIDVPDSCKKTIIEIDLVQVKEDKNSENSEIFEKRNAVDSTGLEFKLNQPLSSLPLKSEKQKFLAKSMDSLEEEASEQKGESALSAMNKNYRASNAKGFTEDKDDETELQPKEFGSKETKEGAGSCLSGSYQQEDFSECDGIYGHVSSSKKHGESFEHFDDDEDTKLNGHSTSVTPNCGDIPSESSEDRPSNGVECDHAHSNTHQAESSEHTDNVSPVGSDNPSNHSEWNEHINNDRTISDEFDSGIRHDDGYHNGDGPVKDISYPSGRHPKGPCLMLPLYGLSRNCLRLSTQQSLSTKTQGKELKEKEESNDTCTDQAPSTSGFICPPFHGLSRAMYIPQWKSSKEELSKTKVQKRKDDDEESYELDLTGKRMKQDDTESNKEKSELPHSSASVDELQYLENPSMHDVSGDIENNSDSESLEWHDALEATEP